MHFAKSLVVLSLFNAAIASPIATPTELEKRQLGNILNNLLNNVLPSGTVSGSGNANVNGNANIGSITNLGSSLAGLTASVGNLLQDAVSRILGIQTAAQTGALNQVNKAQPFLNLPLILAGPGLLAFQNAVAQASNQPTTVNTILNNAADCKANTILFARGVNEPGNLGSLVGPAFVNFANSIAGSGNTAVIGFNYDATANGFLNGGDPAATAAAVQQIVNARAVCPTTNLVLAGFGSGAQLIRNAVAKLNATVAQSINKVVLFADPKNGAALPNIDASKLKSICSALDNICSGGNIINQAYLNYAQSAQAGAQFAISGSA